MTLNQRSLDNLKGVHPDLVRVVHRAAELSPVPIVVTEGLRNLDRQKELKAAGKSWTLDSRHLSGHAVDLVDADDYRYDIPDMTKIAGAMRQAAAELKIPLVWGGSWKQRDTPHFELDRKAYPASGVSAVTKVKEVTTKAVTSRPAVAVGSGVATGVTIDAVTSVPAPSIPVPPDLSAVSAWKSFGATVSELLSWAGAHPTLTVCIGAWIGSVVFWGRIKAVFAKWRAA
jgi:peptidoglycan L-alanyl-D-glutamate endopeptidase CwlK